MVVEIDYTEGKKLRNWRSVKLFDFLEGVAFQRNQIRESREIIWWEGR